jgi:hypothetical protein
MPFCNVARLQVRRDGGTRWVPWCERFLGPPRLLTFVARDPTPRSGGGGSR